MAKKKKPGTIQNEITEEGRNMIANGLTEAILGFNPASMGVQLSQADTLFNNNRWYLISNMRQLLSQIYIEHGLIQTIVDLPVDDALRGGIEIKTNQIDPDDLDALKTKMEEEDDISAVGQALKWKRLYGGSGIIINTAQDPTTPLDMASIKEGDLLEFRDVDMWELYHDMQMQDDRGVLGPKLTEVEHFNYYGQKIHKSRVIVMKGRKAPAFIRPRLRGWGLSEVETLVRSVNQYLKSTNLVFEVMDEFKVDYFKIKGLASTVASKNGEEIVRKRIALANAQKNFQNAVTMDAEDDFQQKQLNFAGISEAMEGIRMQVASDMRMPLTKLFGISAAGFSSGEDDIENYNSMIEGSIRAKAKYDMLKIVRIRCQQMFGFVPDDLKIEFQSLRILSSEQEENVKTQKFARVIQARQAGELSTEEFRDAVNKDSLLPIQLDTSSSALAGVEREAAAKKSEGEGEAPAPKGAKSATETPEAPTAKNSIGFDKAEFEADGGNEQFLHEPIGEPSDKALWQKAIEMTEKAFGNKDRWQFTTWWFKKNGGKFK